MIAVSLLTSPLLLSISPKLDQDGNQALDRDGRPMSRAVLAYMSGEGAAEMLSVSLPSEGAAALEPMTAVTPIGLRAGAFKDKLYWKAEGLTAVSRPAASRPKLGS